MLLVVGSRGGSRWTLAAGRGLQAFYPKQSSHWSSENAGRGRRKARNCGWPGHERWQILEP